MKTQFIIKRKNRKLTYVYEFWDDFLIYKYKVFADYQGGDIIQFLRNNSILRSVDFNGVNELLRSLSISDF